MTPFVFKDPLDEVEDHALVYGDLTAKGMAGGRAGEYAGTTLLGRRVRTNPSGQSDVECPPIAIFSCGGRALGSYQTGETGEDSNWKEHAWEISMDGSSRR